MKKVILSIIGASLVLSVFGVFFEVKVITGRAMEPTLTSEEKILIGKLPLPIERGDIITYSSGNRDVSRIGRVIALPGEAIKIDRDGKIYIQSNGKKYELIERYRTNNVNLYLAEEKVWRNIPIETYFVLPDTPEENYMNIPDRYVPKAHIEGKVLLEF